MNSQEPFGLSHYLGQHIIEGSPKSTRGKKLQDGYIEQYGNYAQKSRKQVNFHRLNGTDVASIENALVSGVIGSEINIQSVTNLNNIDQEFEDLVAEHSEVENFDTTGRFHRDEALRKIIGFELTQGGVLIRHHYNNAWAIPYRVELVGVDMIDTRMHNDLEKVYNGIKLDSYNRVIGIYLYSDNKKSTSSLISMKNMTYYSTVWASLSQYTAVSRLVSILPTLDMKREYSYAELDSALKKAKSGVYWTTELYSIIKDAVDQEFREEKASGREKLIEAQDLVNRLAKRGVGTDGAVPIPKDDKIFELNTKSDTVYSAITNNTQKEMASATGGSQVGIYRDIEKGNYASIKAAISFDEETYKIEFNNLVNKVINEYLKRLFIVGVQTNRIRVSRRLFFANPRKYMSWDILRTSKRIIDEQKKANADAKNLESDAEQLNVIYAEKGKVYYDEKKKQLMIEQRIKREEIKQQLELEKFEREEREKMGLPEQNPNQEQTNEG